MKHFKALIIIPFLATMSMMACGGKTKPNNGGESNEPAPVVTPTNIETLKTNIQSMKNLTLSELASVEMSEEESLGEGLPSYQYYIAEEMRASIKVTENAVETTQDISFIIGVKNVSVLAKSLGISTEKLLENVSKTQPIKYYDASKDIAVVDEMTGVDNEIQWYSIEDDQWIEYEEDDGDIDVHYILDGDKDDVISEMPTVLNTIIDNASFNAKTNEFTITEEQAAAMPELFDGEVKSLTLVVENNYPKTMRASLEEYDVLFEISAIGTTSVTVPDAHPEPCEYDHYCSHRYEELPDGHREYCDGCDKYLAPKEAHTFPTNEDNHEYCTKCRQIVNKKSLPESFSLLADNESSWAYLYKSNTDNKIYLDYLRSYSNSVNLRYADNFYAYYHPITNQLVVFKAYAGNDKTLSNPYEYKLIGTCTKTLKGTIEVFSNVTVENYEYINSSLTDEQYITFRAENEPVQSVECYRVFTSHSSTTRHEEVINDCQTFITYTCNDCGIIDSAYSSYNHDYNEGGYVNVDPCHVRWERTCSKCGHVYKDSILESHKDATYIPINNETYLLMKYGLEKNNSYKYCEMSCPTCKKNCLIELHSSSMTHARESVSCYTYEMVNDQLVTQKGAKFLIPHLLNEYGICQLCDRIVIDYANIEFYFNYSMYSDNRLKTLSLDTYNLKDSSIYMEQTFGGEGWMYHFYSDDTKATLICEFEFLTTTNQATIYDDHGNVAYRAIVGSLLPLYPAPAVA